MTADLRLTFPRWVGVVCKDLERQRRFYHDVLGLVELERGDDWIQFDLGSGVTFELIARSEAPEYDGARYQVGFAVDDIRTAREELVRRGARPIGDVQGRDSHWAYFRDPEGNVFEITQRD
jgi:catechol 2,3-dioxygenase-like lactoylglutathione lyase family enzyme